MGVCTSSNNKKGKEVKANDPKDKNTKNDNNKEEEKK